MSIVITAIESCVCATSGKSAELHICKDHHRYWLGDRRLASVSEVIKTLLPTDYSGVDPIVLEIARLRGSFVDQYWSDWLLEPDSVVPLEDIPVLICDQFPRDGEKYALDTVNRIKRLLEWWSKQNLKVKAVQKTVFSEADGIAGTLDLWTLDEMILDLKCVSSLQISYQLQLGSYLKYSFAERCGIIHLTDKACKLVMYEAAMCRRYWQSAVNWWNTLKELKK